MTHNVLDEMVSCIARMAEGAVNGLPVTSWAGLQATVSPMKRKEVFSGRLKAASLAMRARGRDESILVEALVSHQWCVRRHWTPQGRVDGLPTNHRGAADEGDVMDYQLGR